MALPTEHEESAAPKINSISCSPFYLTISLFHGGTPKSTSRRNAFIENVVLCVVHGEENERFPPGGKDFNAGPHKAASQG